MRATFSEGVEETKQGLESLGADIVWTYDDLGDKAKVAQFKEFTKGRVREHVLPTPFRLGSSSSHLSLFDSR